MDIKAIDKNINTDKSININMLKRTISGFIVGWLCFGCLLYGGLPLLILVFIVSTIGSLEFVKILNHKGFYPFKSTIIFTNLIILVLAGLKEFNLIPFAIFLGTAFSFLSVIFKGRQPYIANVATTTLGFLYCGWLPAHIMMLRHADSISMNLLKFEINNGIIFLLMYFFGVLMTDIGAFYFGKKFGKHKLAPVISPNKSWEGAIGGGISCIIICLAIGIFTGLPVYHSIIIGIIATVFAQLGDLGESLIKRDAGVKDSGSSIPGHGGFLDRTDGYLFAAPFVYYYVYYFVLHNNFFGSF